MLDSKITTTVYASYISAKLFYKATDFLPKIDLKHINTSLLT